jgi:hypothetical protein
VPPPGGGGTGLPGRGGGGMGPPGSGGGGFKVLPGPGGPMGGGGSPMGGGGKPRGGGGIIPVGGIRGLKPDLLSSVYTCARRF